VSVFSSAFVKYALDRALNTVAQSLIGVLSVSGIGLLDVNWVGALSVTGAMTLLSLLTSVRSWTGVSTPSSTTTNVVNTQS
jgi:hypothetical protein